MAKILIVDDEKDIRDLLGDILQDENHTTDLVGHAQAAIDHIDTQGFDLIILDIWLKESQMDGIDILKYIKGTHPQTPVVIISGHGNIEIAVAAIKQGAFDFIEKPFNVDQLLVVVNRALEISKLRKIARISDSQTISNPNFSDLLGSSPAIKNLRLQLEKLGKSKSRVMFRGPSGSGKELSARYLHANSGRADQPFIVANSALMVAEDMERQLFGYEEGGIVHQGLLERANGGMLFFDEIADMPLETQGKILRIINDQKFERVGSGQVISVDIRFCSATKEDLEELMKQGRFREELFHRLGVVPIDIPPLKNRVEDVEELANHFANILAERENLPAKTLARDAIETLQTYTWQGNVRELRNRVEHALILSNGATELTAEDFQKPGHSEQVDEISSEYLFLPLREARELFEHRYLSSQIDRFSGNISRTANFIGMERSALHRKLKSLNVGGQDRKNA